MYKTVDEKRERVLDLEWRLGIDRWHPKHPHFIEAQKYARNRAFLLGLDKLERLVVQRMMELQKCHRRETGKLICFSKSIKV